jgi:hypothetical protein
MPFYKCHGISALAICAGVIEPRNARGAKVNEPVILRLASLGRHTTAIVWERYFLYRDTVLGEVNDEIVEFGSHQYSFFGTIIVTATTVSQTAGLGTRIRHISPMRGCVTRKFGFSETFTFTHTFSFAGKFRFNGTLSVICSVPSKFRVTDKFWGRIGLDVPE